MVYLYFCLSAVFLSVVLRSAIYLQCSMHQHIEICLFGASSRTKSTTTEHLFTVAARTHSHARLACVSVCANACVCAIPSGCERDNCSQLTGAAYMRSAPHTKQNRSMHVSVFSV